MIFFFEEEEEEEEKEYTNKDKTFLVNRALPIHWD